MSAKADTDTVLAWLRRKGSKKVRDGLSRFAIPDDDAFGVPVGELRKYAKTIGRDHGLALELWETGKYEARLLATFVGEPDAVTLAQMDRWCRDFDNWAVCDTACFALFDRTPHAFRKVAVWSRRKGEFQKRAAFALLASLAQHDKKSPDAPFVKCLPLIEQAAGDGRNFVKKAVNWALRGVGERSLALHRRATALAGKLAASPDTTRRWIGKDAARQLASPAVTKRLQRRSG